MARSSKGLSIWKNNGDDVALDADNAFWGITKQPQAKDREDSFIGRDLLGLYGKVRDNLDKEMRDFRFSQELSAVYIDPTDRCNANCPYCYVPEILRRNGRSMTGEELTGILEKIKAYFGVKKRKPVIIFHASEPLLVKEIIFEAIVKFGRYFKFGLQTNATLLKKEDVEFLSRHRVGVGISLDSSLPSINNRSRIGFSGQGNFASAVRAIEWFDGYAGLNIIATVTRINVDSLPVLVKFLHGKKVPCVLLNPVRLTQKNSRKAAPDETALTKRFIQAVDTAIELSSKARHKIIVGNFANTILAIISPASRRMMCDISPCGGARCFFTITAKGDMIPCGEFIGLKGFSGGNIFRAKIEDAMESAPFKKIRARVAEDIPECRDCSFRNICGAPCPAEMHSLGNMRRKSVFCEFYKEAIKHAFKIIAEKKEKYCLRTEGMKNLKYQYDLS